MVWTNINCRYMLDALDTSLESCIRNPHGGEELTLRELLVSLASDDAPLP